MKSMNERRRRPRTLRLGARDVRITFDQGGVLSTAAGRLTDLHEEGCGFEIPVQLAQGQKIMLSGDLANRGGQMQVRGTVSWVMATGARGWKVGIQFELPINLKASAAARPEGVVTDQPDYYEVLQLSPNADFDTVQRVYRLLAQRYHPDNQTSGNADTFRRVLESYQVLSDPQRRAAYDVSYHESRKRKWKIFDQPAAAQGAQGEKAKRQGVLALLYHKRINTPEQPHANLIEMEDVLGVPREHLEFTMWYLRESGMVTRGDNGRYNITVKGVDAVESAETTIPALRVDRLLEARPQ